VGGPLVRRLERSDVFRLWRHKSRKEKFKAEFQMAAAMNVVGLIALIVFGEELLRFLPT
jgi:hypothetical protein